jgi:hypothetical protein
MFVGEFGVLVGTDLSEKVSPAARLTVSAVLLHVVLVPLIVQLNAVSEPFFWTVKA